MRRTVIKIDKGLCNGCGNCISGCHEGALQLIDGKAIMISDLYCDGLGACIGECPVGAIEFEEREAEPYNEIAVMERIVPNGEAVVLAHLKHLKDHNELAYLMQGLEFLKLNNIPFNISSLKDVPKAETKLSEQTELPCGCPGSMARTIIKKPEFKLAPAVTEQSELRQWPVQLHLLSPTASYFQGADVLLAADCTAYSAPNFHSHFLKGKSLAIACPKLDSNTEIYVEKLAAMIDSAQINTLTVLIMEVPCCSGLLRIAQSAREKAIHNVPIKAIILSVEGEVKSTEWL